jgi:hypothetical protein
MRENFAHFELSEAGFRRAPLCTQGICGIKSIGGCCRYNNLSSIDSTFNKAQSKFAGNTVFYN